MAVVVSSITACFRMKNYLKRFLDELPRQTMFEELEVVLDHNEPDDEELAWVREFQEKHPGHLRHIVVPEVDPMGISWNRCLKEATGDLVAIWNVDDLRTPESLARQYEALNKNVGAAIAYGDYRVVARFGATEGSLVSLLDAPREEFTRSMLLGPFFMFKKELCQKAGYFDEQLRSGADFDLAVRLAFHAEAVRAEGELGYYLNEGLGASTRPNSPQPVERTIVELRYGIYDKIDYDLICRASRYSIPYLQQPGGWKHVREFLPGYDQMIAEREERWLRKGLNAFAFRFTLSGKLSRLWQGLLRRIERNAKRRQRVIEPKRSQ